MVTILLSGFREQAWKLPRPRGAFVSRPPRTAEGRGEIGRPINISTVMQPNKRAATSLSTSFRAVCSSWSLW